MTRVALIGAGTMGAMHARVISQTPGAELTHVVDPDIDRAQLVAKRFGGRAVTELGALEIAGKVMRVPGGGFVKLDKSAIGEGNG